MTSKNNLSVVIDIGTSKLAGLAGRKHENGKIEILAYAKTISRGFRRGLVFNIEEAASSLKKLIDMLEEQLEEQIDEVDVAYAGQHFKTVLYSASRFTSEDGVVSEFDIVDLLNEAKKAEVESGYRLNKVIPKSFVVDNEPVNGNPVGITGKKIDASYQLVLIPEVYENNLRRVFDKVEVELRQITLASLALAENVATTDEKELGAIVLDMGAGTTNLAIYSKNMLCYTAVIPFGGDVITLDIKEGCSILVKWAEKLKVQYGQALGDKAEDQKMVTIRSENGWEPKEISFKSLAFIIQARLVEILGIINYHIQNSGIDGNMGAGIILAGGTANLKDIVAFLQYETGMQVRKASSKIHPVNKIKDLNDPAYLVALGLLKMSLNNYKSQPKKKPKTPRTNRFIPRLMDQLQGALDLFTDENEDLELN